VTRANSGWKTIESLNRGHSLRRGFWVDSGASRIAGSVAESCINLLRDVLSECQEKVNRGHAWRWGRAYSAESALQGEALRMEEVVLGQESAPLLSVCQVVFPFPLISSFLDNIREDSFLQEKYPRAKSFKMPANLADGKLR
jgi:hypothetical protein